ERNTLAGELRHWRDAVTALGDLDAVASPAAWSGLGSYLGKSVRASLTATTPRPAPPTQPVGSAPAAAATRREPPPPPAPLPRPPLPAGRDGRGILRRGHRGPVQPTPGGRAARPRRACRGQHGEGARAAGDRRPAGAHLSRQGPRRLDLAGQGPAVGRLALPG